MRLFTKILKHRNEILHFSTHKKKIIDLLMTNEQVQFQV